MQQISGNSYRARHGDAGSQPRSFALRLIRGSGALDDRFEYALHAGEGIGCRVGEPAAIYRRFGGSIGQLVFPVAFVVHFARRAQWFEAAVMAVWVAESLMYMAQYMGDAQAQLLPLVGGHIHDWHWLLSHAGLLDHCELLASLVHGFACVLAFAAVGLAAWTVRPGKIGTGT